MYVCTYDVVSYVSVHISVAEDYDGCEIAGISVKREGSPGLFKTPNPHTIITKALF